MIAAGSVNVTYPVRIHEDADIWVSDHLSIGQYTVIKSGFKAKCRSLTIGRHCYIHEGVEIGFGGCMGLNAHVHIGDYVGIFQNTHINCAEPVYIGDCCGLGQEVKIWTHGTWLPVAEGFPPQKQEPVRIGDKVWLPARTQVLAGVEIGDNVVVGINSLVNKSLPSGCFAAGIPAKVIKENVYPKPLTTEELMQVARELCAGYLPIAQDKGFQPDCLAPYLDTDNGHVYIDFQMSEGEGAVEFDLSDPSATYLPGISEYEEDFRDYLRRNGFKFHNGGFFKSMLPTRFTEVR